jgi:opacity protein-like surface antigen
VKTKLAAGLIVLFVMAVFVGTAAADPGFRFQGYIKDSSGNGMGGVSVEIKNTNTGDVWTATTGSDGQYLTTYLYYLTADPVSGDYEMRLDGSLVAKHNGITAADFEFDGVFWYIAHWTYTWDYQIPEFATIAMPVASILGLLFFFNHRKRRKE